MPLFTCPSATQSSRVGADSGAQCTWGQSAPVCLILQRGNSEAVARPAICLWPVSRAFGPGTQAS